MKEIKRIIIQLLNQLPYIKKLKEYEQRFPPGHYYSTIPADTDINRAIALFSKKELAGIELNEAQQIELLKSLSAYYSSIDYFDFSVAEKRYYFNNNYFQHSDAYLLESLLLLKKPKKIIEVGSGFSSAQFLDINDKYFNKDLQLTFIEPHPEERLEKLLRDSDKQNKKITVLKSLVQDVQPQVFKELDKNDILFIDSTHVSKAGSDLNFLLFEILPMLKPGVLIHFHDVFYPFEYPAQWLKDGFYWNENYVLRAFLMYNNQFDILFFNTFLDQSNNPLVMELKKAYPMFFKIKTGSIWITRK